MAPSSAAGRPVLSSRGDQVRKDSRARHALVFLFVFWCIIAFLSTQVSLPFLFLGFPLPYNLPSAVLFFCVTYFQTGHLAWDISPISSFSQSQKNEVFLDVVERLSVLIASNVSWGVGAAEDRGCWGWLMVGPDTRSLSGLTAEGRCAGGNPTQELPS